MGKPKQLLPWRGSTVLATVVENLNRAGAQPVVCVLGHRSAEVRATLHGHRVTILDNPDFDQSDMLRSIQIGITHLAQIPALTGTLLALGDQPHISRPTIRRVLAASTEHPDRIVIPSYRMRRGHPFYLPRILWDEVADLSAQSTVRDLINRNTANITYVNMETDTILQDMDTPEEYTKLRPSALIARQARETGH